MSSPNGFHLIHNCVPNEAWETIKGWLGLDLDDPCLGFQTNNNGTVRQQQEGGAGVPWEAPPASLAQYRPVVQFSSARYDYVNDVVDTQKATPDIPALLKRLLLDSKAKIDGAIGSVFDPESFSQCIINIYCSSSSSDMKSMIPWHIDDETFGPVIVVFVFGEARPLMMRRLRTPACDPEKEQGTEDSRAGELGIDQNRHSMYEFYNAHPQHRDAYILSGPARASWEHSVPAGVGWRVSITFRTLR